MLKKIKVSISIIAIFSILFTLLPVNVQAAITLTSNATGTIDGYDYEYWKDNGTGTMTLNGGGTFSCSWSNINNILFRPERSWDRLRHGRIITVSELITHVTISPTVTHIWVSTVGRKIRL
jgi:hypothetical protein